jgi:hypothetical protein
MLTAWLGGCLGDAPSFAGESAAKPMDRPSPKPSCGKLDPFQPPVAILELSTQRKEATSRLTPDELTIYLSYASEPMANVEAPFQIVMATRTSQGERFGNLRPLPLEVGASGPSISADGKTLYFTIDKGSTGPDLHMAEAPFEPGSEVPLTTLNTDQWEFVPYLSVSGRSLYYARAPSIVDDIPAAPELKKMDLYVSHQVAGVFEPGRPLVEINTDANEKNPVISADELHLYFGSDRANGNYDVYVASRASVNEPFGTPEPVPELNSFATDTPNWISEDDCRIYLTTHRRDISNGDIWFASRR